MRMEAQERFQLIALMVLPVIVLVGLAVKPYPVAVTEAWDQWRLAETHNRPAAAALHLERVLAWMPWQTQLWEEVGQAKFAAGDWEGAIAAFERARADDQLSVDGHFLLADALKQTERLDEAHQIWQALLEKPGLTGDHFRRLSEELAAFDPAMAAGVYRRWADREPDNARVHYRLGMFTMIDDPQQGLEQLTRAANLESRYRPAEEQIRAVLDEYSHTDEPIRLVALGRLFGSLGEWILAERAFERAVTVAPNWADGWAFLGEAKQNLGKDGLVELEQAVRLDPESVLTRALMALYWRRQGRPENSLEHLREAAALEPENAVWQIELGYACELTGDLHSASEHYQKAVVLEPENPKTWQALAVFSAQNQLDLHGTGLPAARQAYLLAPNDPVAADLLAWIFYLLEDFDSAERFLQQALQQAPDLASAHLHRAQLLLAKENVDQAADHLAEAVRLDPDGAVGQLARRLLEKSK